MRSHVGDKPLATSSVPPVQLSNVAGMNALPFNTGLTVPSVHNSNGGALLILASITGSSYVFPAALKRAQSRPPID